jgi:DNA-binding CsgD family transcriptional regulator
MLSENPWLIIPGVDPSRWSYRIAPGHHVAGRTPDCHLYLPHPSVSRLHAEIRSDGNRLSILDLGSRNGTFVNDVQIHQSSISLGQRLRLGTVVLEVVGEPEPMGDESTFGHCEANEVSAPSPINRRISLAQDRVLRLVLQGLSEKKIAEQLYLSNHTVHSHLKHIYRVYNVHSRAELMALWLSGSGTLLSPNAQH